MYHSLFVRFLIKKLTNLGMHIGIGLLCIAFLQTSLNRRRLLQNKGENIYLVLQVYEKVVNSGRKN